MQNRDFIQETIETLRRASTNIEKNYDKFNNGEITKEAFETIYKHILSDDVFDELAAEVNDCPNHGHEYNF